MPDEAQAPPQILSFDGPDQVVAGAEITLAWKLGGGAAAQLLLDGEPVQGSSCKVKVVRDPTWFVLRARNAAGEAQRRKAVGTNRVGECVSAFAEVSPNAIAVMNGTRFAEGVSPKSLEEIMPQATKADVNRYCQPLNWAMREFEIDTPRRRAAFLAQLAGASSSLASVEERGTGAEHEGNAALGNTHPGDGRKYKGRGLIQIAGRSEYQAMGKALGVDLLADPGRLTEPMLACRAAAGWYYAHHLNGFADAGDFRGLCLRVNRGPADEKARAAFWARAKRALGDSTKKIEPALTMAEALRDGYVTAAEAAFIAATYQQDGALKTQHAELVAYYEAHQDSFAVGAQETITKLLHDDGPALTEPGPTTDYIPPGGTSSEVPAISGYQRRFGRLFDKGVSLADLEQRSLGDCYFLSSVCSVVHQSPANIERMMVANPDGTVTITFWGSATAGGPLQQIPIRIDRRMPVAADDPSYDNNGPVDPNVQDPDGDELWPQLLEKAFALFVDTYPWNLGTSGARTGFNAIGEGGYGADPLRALTGRVPVNTPAIDYTIPGVPTSSSLPDLDANQRAQLWAALSSSANSMNPTVAATLAAANLQPAAGLVGPHMYSVFGTNGDNGGSVILHNPWGFRLDGGIGPAIFEVTFEVFLTNFFQVTWLA